MKLPFIIKKIEDVAENLRKLYKDNGKGEFQLDVEGVVEASALTAKDDQIKTLQAQLKGDDGKTYKEMFEGSQNTNKAVREEVKSFKAQLKKWQDLGELEEIQTWKDELEGLRAKGATLEESQKQIAELKHANREYSAKVSAVEKKVAEFEEQNRELVAYKQETQRRIDFADAESQISEIVDGIKGANAKALKRNLVDRYRAGDLVRDKETNKLITVDGDMTLEAYAKDTMEAYNLVLPNQGGLSDPPIKTTPPTDGGGQTTYASIAAQLK